jgi:hypothetical protein
MNTIHLVLGTHIINAPEVYDFIQDDLSIILKLML